MIFHDFDIYRIRRIICVQTSAETIRTGKPGDRGQHAFSIIRTPAITRKKNKAVMVSVPGYTHSYIINIVELATRRCAA